MKFEVKSYCFDIMLEIEHAPIGTRTMEAEKDLQMLKLQITIKLHILQSSFIPSANIIMPHLLWTLDVFSARCLSRP